MPKKQNKKPPEIELIQQAQNLQKKKSGVVSEMEDMVNSFDIQKILNLNEKLKAYYKKVGDEEALDLLDRMTVVMDELSEIINQVKSKRISLEQGQREIQEKLSEINEVLKMMQDWEATGL